MDSPGTLSRTIEAIYSILSTVKILWLVFTTKSFPPLTVDIARIICEFAAELDKETASSLYISSKTIREWVTPIHFRRLEVSSYESLRLLKAPRTLRRIAPYVYSVSLQIAYRDDYRVDPCKLAVDLNSFLRVLPNLVHFRWPYYSWYGEVGIILPRHVFSLEISYDYLAEERKATFTQPHITHLISNLQGTPLDALFTTWTSLTHLFFEIHHQYHLDNSIVNSTFPLRRPFVPLPASIVSCILMDTQGASEQFKWTINKTFIDLVLGDTEPRIVFAVWTTRDRWMTVLPGMNRQTVDMSWIRIALQGAIVFHAHWQKNYETIWEQAEEVRRKRTEFEVRESVYQLLNRRS
ncbi:hypothetical protein DL96DRAFT_272168 [Flagelloscypha sp. PMI_526]|nr:hypothetical protein DL96DRAFT_272168 [Flagelloscypha sp. PMI_526]